MKKLQVLSWIPNTIMNINVLEYFDNIYISDGVRIALSTHGLEYISLIAFVRTG